MGLLKEDKDLSWREIVDAKNEIKRRGIAQFVECYHAHKDKRVSQIAFGQEMELMVAGRRDGAWRLLTEAEHLVEELALPGLTPEYASYMLEISPCEPYVESTWMDVEKDIVDTLSFLRLQAGDRFGESNVLMLPVFPNLAERFFSGSGTFRYNITQSEFFPDEAISSHRRFMHFTENIRNRRGKRIEGYVETMRGDGTGSIRIDSMGQGMGCCSLQTTVQADCLDEARTVYDMLGAFCPILLRLTAGSPIAQGRLLNTETRWEMLSMAVDCRTDEERGSAFDVSGSVRRMSGAAVPKSRFSSIDLFISSGEMNLEEYNNLSPPLDSVSYDALVQGDVDRKMAEHIASLFARDPILSYRATEGRDDFENIQSSNWRSMRLNLPDEDAEEGFRGFKVETRVMEIQATPFENAAFIYFNFLLSRVIVSYRCNLYIPLSLVDDNFLRANLLARHRSEYFSRLSRDRQKFHYRINIFDRGPPVLRKGTVDEIMNGTHEFCGMLELVRNAIDDMFGGCSRLHRYIDFVEKKSRGEYMSLSDWIRRFVLTHRSYAGDAEVCDEIANSLLDALKAISIGNSVGYLLNK